jgi:hypothetical protein
VLRGLAAVGCILAGLPAADASPVRVEVQGDRCDFNALESQLTQVLGSDPIDSNAHALVSIELMSARGLFEAGVTFDDGDGGVRGPRIVTAKSCNELVESVALVIAMALPDLHSTDADKAVTAPPAKPVVEASPRAFAVTERASVVRTKPDLAFFIAGAGGVKADAVQGQLIVGGRLRRGSASLTAEMRADAPQEYDTERMGGIRVFRAQVSVSPCWHLGSVAGCAVASAGTIHGSGLGLTSARSVYRPLASGGLRVTWEHRLVGSIAVRLHLDADTLITTTQFDVDNVKVWVSPRFEGSAGFGVLAHFL